MPLSVGHIGHRYLICTQIPLVNGVGIIRRPYSSINQRMAFVSPPVRNDHCDKGEVFICEGLCVSLDSERVHHEGAVPELLTVSLQIDGDVALIFIVSWYPPLNCDNLWS